MPWQPGQSGNPKGRPILGNSVAEKLRDGGFEDIAIKMLRERVVAGDLKALEMWFDRAYGKALDRITFPQEEDQEASIDELKDLIALLEKRQSEKRTDPTVD